MKFNQLPSSPRVSSLFSSTHARCRATRRTHFCENIDIAIAILFLKLARKSFHLVFSLYKRRRTLTKLVFLVPSFLFFHLLFRNLRFIVDCFIEEKKKRTLSLECIRKRRNKNRLQNFSLKCSALICARIQKTTRESLLRSQNAFYKLIICEDYTQGTFNAIIRLTLKKEKKKFCV